MPPSRFADTVTLLNTGDGGYTIPTGAFPINFMIVSLDAAFAFNAYKSPKFIAAAENQKSDENLFYMRHFYDAFVLSNRGNGVYVNKSATAVA